MDKTVYNLLITNTAAYIRSDKNLDDVVEGNGLDAYQAGKALGAALCKEIHSIVNGSFESFEKMSDAMMELYVEDHLEF